MITNLTKAVIDIERPKIDCLSVVMCPLLVQLKTGFFSIFFAAAVYSTTEANKASLKQSIILRCLWPSHSSQLLCNTTAILERFVSYEENEVL